MIHVSTTNTLPTSSYAATIILWTTSVVSKVVTVKQGGCLREIMVKVSITKSLGKVHHAAFKVKKLFG